MLHIIANLSFTTKGIPTSTSISLLGKLKGGEIDSMKVLKLLNENGSLSKDLIINFEEMNFQKCAEYSGDVIGMSEENKCYKSIVFFMVVV